MLFRPHILRLIRKPWFAAMVSSLFFALTLWGVFQHYTQVTVPLANQFQYRVNERLASLDLRLNLIANALTDLRVLLKSSPEALDRSAAIFSQNVFERFPEVSLISVFTMDSLDANIHQIQFDRSGALGNTLVEVQELTETRLRLSFNDERDKRLRISSRDFSLESKPIDLILPVFFDSDIGTPTTIASIVHLRVSTPKLFSESIAGLKPAGIDFLLYDKDEKLIYAHHSRLRTKSPTDFVQWQDLHDNANFHAEYAFLIGGLNWSIHTISVNEIYSPYTFFVWLQLFIGILLSMGVYALIQHFKNAAKTQTLEFRALKKKQLQSEYTQKHLSEELNRFTYVLSHDFRAPLRHLRSFPMMAIEDIGAQIDDTTRQTMHRIANTAERMGSLMDNLLKLSRVGRSDMMFERCNLSAIATAAYMEARNAHSEAEVQFRCTPELYVIADSSLLSVALYEAFDNALKYSAHRVIAEIQFGVDLRSGTAHYFVRDNGKGLNKAEANRLFEPFNQLNAEDRFGGVGIGLAIFKRVIERHEGKVWIESEPDKFTVLYFSLPQSY